MPVFARGCGILDFCEWAGVLHAPKCGALPTGLHPAIVKRNTLRAPSLAQRMTREENLGSHLAYYIPSFRSVQEISGCRGKPHARAVIFRAYILFLFTKLCYTLICIIIKRSTPWDFFRSSSAAIPTGS